MYNETADASPQELRTKHIARLVLAILFVTLVVATSLKQTSNTNAPTPKSVQTKSAMKTMEMNYRPFTEAPGIQQLNKAYNLLLGRGFNPNIANEIGLFTNKLKKYGDFGSQTGIIPDQVAESMNPHCVYSGKTSKVFQGDSTQSGTFEKSQYEQGFSAKTKLSASAKGVTVSTELEGSMMYGQSHGAKSGRSEAKRGYSSQFVLSSRGAMWVATVNWNNKFYPFSFDKEFEARMASLNKVVANNASADVVQVETMKTFVDYGTHVVKKATFGAECHLTVGMKGGTSSSEYNSFRTSSETSSMKALWYQKKGSTTKSQSASGRTAKGFEYKTTNVACNGQMTTNVCDPNMNAKADEPAMIGAVGMPIWEIAHLKRAYPGATGAMRKLMDGVIAATAACGTTNCGSRGVCQIAPGFWDDVMNGNWDGRLHGSLFSSECICFPGTTSANCGTKSDGVLKWVKNNGENHKSCSRICKDSSTHPVNVQSVGYMLGVEHSGLDVCAVENGLNTEAGYVKSSKCHSAQKANTKFACLCAPSADQFKWVGPTNDQILACAGSSKSTCQKMGCERVCDANGLAAVGSQKWSSGDRRRVVCSGYVANEGNLVGFPSGTQSNEICGVASEKTGLPKKLNQQQYHCLCMSRTATQKVKPQNPPLIWINFNGPKTEDCVPICAKLGLPPVNTGKLMESGKWGIPKGADVNMCRGTSGNLRGNVGFNSKHNDPQQNNHCSTQRGVMHGNFECACNTLNSKLHWVDAAGKMDCPVICQGIKMKAISPGSDGKPYHICVSKFHNWVTVPGVTHGTTGTCWAVHSVSTNKRCLCE